MNYASTILIEEHRAIERVLTVLNKAVFKLEEGEIVQADLFLKVSEFIRNFIDKCHHVKEEDIFFKMMRERGFSFNGGPLGCILAEHKLGRKYTKFMEVAAKRLQKGDESSKKEIIHNARKYTEILLKHIYSENNIIYPMGDRVFSVEEQKYLIQKFERLNKEEIGEGIYRNYLKLVEEIEDMIT